MILGDVHQVSPETSLGKAVSWRVNGSTAAVSNRLRRGRSVELVAAIAAGELLGVGLRLYRDHSHRRVLVLLVHLPVGLALDTGEGPELLT